MGKNKQLKTTSIILLGILMVQYLLGMATNLFVQFPQSQNASQLWEFAWKQLPLASHIITGIALLIGAVVLLIQSIKKRQRKWILVSTIGLVSIIVAGYSGATFIPTQINIYSFIMSLGFIIALLSYVFGVCFLG